MQESKSANLTSKQSTSPIKVKNQPSNLNKKPQRIPSPPKPDPVALMKLYFRQMMNDLDSSTLR